MASGTSYRLIGIDFGTTYSGVAWTWSERPENVTILNQWTGTDGIKNAVKVPTQIVYNANGTIAKWGYEVTPSDDSIKWFKLLLLEKKSMPDYICTSPFVIEAEKKLQRLGKDAVDVVGDYLGCLWKRVMEEMRRGGGSLLDSQPFRVVITTPAIWSDAAKDKMNHAVRRAGILDRRLAGPTKLHFIDEPEAGALAVMDDDNGRTVRRNETFIICDAGGGTVDLITYTVHDFEQKMLKESVKGDGDMCGAVFLDQRFKEKLEEWIGSKKWNKVSSIEQDKILQKHWEHGIKPKFNGQGGAREIPLHPNWTSGSSFRSFLRRSKGPKIKNQDLRLTVGVRDDIRPIFDKTVNRILALITQQVSATIKKTGKSPSAILLVGGFGTNAYLHQVLEQHFHEDQGIEVRRPDGDNAWSAILRGAAVRARIEHEREFSLPTKLEIYSTISRRSYGIAYMARYDPNLHQGEEKQFVESLGYECVMNLVEWYIKIGQDVVRDSPVRFSWQRRIPHAPVDNRLAINLLTCTRDPPPGRVEHDVEAHCSLMCPINEPFSQLPRHDSNGRVFRSVDFEIVMRQMGTVLDFFTCRNGHEFQPVHVNYN